MGASIASLPGTPGDSLERQVHHTHVAPRRSVRQLCLTARPSFPTVALGGGIMAQRQSDSPVENRIRSRRQAAGLSQQELARRCGLTRQAINAIEAGHYTPSTLVALRL